MRMKGGGSHESNDPRNHGARSAPRRRRSPARRVAWHMPSGTDPAPILIVRPAPRALAAELHAVLAMPGSAPRAALILGTGAAAGQVSAARRTETGEIAPLDALTIAGAFPR